MKRLALIIVLASFSAWGQVSYVPPGQIIKDGGTEIMGTVRSWSSSSRYDVDTEEVPFESGESFSYIEGEFFGTYGLTKDLQFTFNANFRQNRADVLNTSNDIESITSTGLQGLGGMLSYGLEPVGRLFYTLEGFYKYRPYSNPDFEGTDVTKDFVLGDDGGDYGAGLVMSYRHPSQNFLSGRLHYRRPGTSLSPEINWQVEGALAWKYFALVAGAQGVQSLNQDAYTDEPSDKPVINTGGSQIYNSINRQYMAPYVGANIALGKKWRLEARYQTFTNVRSYDTGSLIMLSLASRSEPDTTMLADQAFKEYELEATVAKLSPKKQFIIIDKGLASDVRNGQRFDLFHFDYLGGNVLLARAVVIQVNADQAVLKITSRFSNKHPIKEGTVARGLSSNGLKRSDEE